MPAPFYTALRVLVIVTATLSFILCVSLTMRVGFKFVSDPEVKNMLMSSIKWTSMSAMISFCLNLGLSVAACFYLAFTDNDLPIGLIFAMGILYGLGKTAKYMLFIVRIHSSFEASVYALSDRSVYSLYAWLTFTVITAAVGFATWDPDLNDRNIRRMLAVLFLCIAGLSHTTMSVYFIHIFVSKLRGLLQRSTFLRVVSNGTTINADDAVRAQVKEASVHDLTREMASGEPTAGTEQMNAMVPMELLDNDVTESTDDEEYDSDWNEETTSPPAPGIDTPAEQAPSITGELRTSGDKTGPTHTRSISGTLTASTAGSLHESAHLKDVSNLTEYKHRTQSVPLAYDSSAEREEMDTDTIRKFKSRSTVAKNSSKMGGKIHKIKHRRAMTAPTDRESQLGLSPIPSESSKYLRKKKSVGSTSSRWRRNSSNLSEKKIVNNVIEKSEFADNTLVVLMARYTLLKIVSVLLSLMSLVSVAIVVSFDINSHENVKHIHESEIVIFFLSLDVSMNVTCLFFTFYSFGFWMFQYNLLCGCLEGWLMHGFESWLKQDFYEQLLVEAKNHLAELLETEDSHELEVKTELEKVETERISRQITGGFNLTNPSAESLAPAVAPASTVSMAVIDNNGNTVGLTSVEMEMEFENLDPEELFRGFSTRQNTGRTATLRQMQKPQLIALASALV